MSLVVGTILQDQLAGRFHSLEIAPVQVYIVEIPILLLEAAGLPQRVGVVRTHFTISLFTSEFVV